MEQDPLLFFNGEIPQNFADNATQAFLHSYTHTCPRPAMVALGLPRLSVDAKNPLPYYASCRVPGDHEQIRT